MPVTAAGKLRHKVNFITRDDSTIPNELGETVATETYSVASYWAWVKPVKTEEVTQNAETVLDATYEVHLRYGSEAAADLTHADAIYYRGRTLEITDIRNLEEGEDAETDREIILTCHEYKPLS